MVRFPGVLWCAESNFECEIMLKCYFYHLKKLKVKTSMSRLKVLGIAITTVRFVFEGFVAELKAECRIMLKCIFDVNTESQRSKHALQGQKS